MTFDDDDLRPFWERNDRAGYVDHAVASKKTAKGLTPTRPVASRWFSVATTFAETNDDIWIHKDRNLLWWTKSLPFPPTVTLEPGAEISKSSNLVYVTSKPALPWQNVDAIGRKLIWEGLHPKAQDFLVTEGTMQELAPENGEYVLALLSGESLEQWESREAWRVKRDVRKKRRVKAFSSMESTVADMALMAMQTAKYSNGQEAIRIVKNKEVRFDSQQDFELYLYELMESQDGLCAISGLKLQLVGKYDDQEMLASLDRIDSSAHYEKGNLQIVCRFINRWKSDDENEEFQRLLAAVRTRSD